MSTGSSGVKFAACDDSDNVNLGVLDLDADAVATATLHYAMSTESVNGVPGRSSVFPFSFWG